ncbi:class I SAM-dependent methyltransferase [Cellulomonas fimi]|uniref:Methyltransferase type 11 n=1 Tax=Cellulomonas fimi (strain ATCC 484 / DSM 20113 / JCM 1341 / CCUG 24087 / LMG 16345 / NBRC 15513 / NCIMB 8980 / NCTC 7547 / NRS-133) TaxID=590998 RepID=F4H6N2_CELFA|nr:class I SAM-dependent methyltransferase [Cellulomonas fimi]AEE46793.1 Methyltransferase type 11 [Cellulomonas fimi ATCC 484]NNH09121.1 class I SAM-dependent methyltransferase [Cellulomonas fimi]VEH34202.1 Ubiquinone/menaquinone biosynthesis methyltransferase ubiE [Cellulomonas fimi]
MDQRAARAASFEHGVAAYQAARPGYPDEVVRWCVPHGARDVLDLAAGTGKLTARLVASGYDVVAVEPSDGMRAELERSVPEADARPGSAEATGLPDACVDAVTVAQAWHWFDEAAAASEVARVLRPGGRLAVLWNVRDATTDWVARWTEIVHTGDPLDTSAREPGLGPAFDAPEHRTFTWSMRMATSDLRVLAASRSHLLTLPAGERDALLDRVDELVATHPDLRGRTEVDVPYVTRAWRASRR